MRERERRELERIGMEKIDSSRYAIFEEEERNRNDCSVFEICDKISRSGWEIEPSSLPSASIISHASIISIVYHGTRMDPRNGSPLSTFYLYTITFNPISISIIGRRSSSMTTSNGNVVSWNKRWSIDNLSLRLRLASLFFLFLEGIFLSSFLFLNISEYVYIFFLDTVWRFEVGNVLEVEKIYF